MLHRAAAFFAENTPTVLEGVLFGPPALVWAFACLALAGYLKRRHGWRTGYTRKVFHFLVFTTAALLQGLVGTKALCLFGGMASLAVFFACWQGNGRFLYEAIAREKDAPRRTYFVLAPYAATLLGGLAANILFGPAAVVGYLVTGFGDAIGEPVGARWGRHPYRVPSLKGVPATRTLEGSAAVGIVSCIAVGLATALEPALPFGSHLLWIAPAIALASMLAEAVSPHGWDNFVLQVLPAGMAWAFWSGGAL